MSSVVLMLAFLILAVASCGGDDSSNGPFTAAEYVDRGNAICTDWLESVIELENELDGSQDQDEIVKFTQTVADLGGNNLAELLELMAPAEYTSEREVLGQAFADMAVMQQDFANGTDDGRNLTQASQRIDSALQGIWPACQR